MPATRPPRGRTLALAAAVGVVAVAVVAAARWEELATRYYLYRLESDESYLKHLVKTAKSETAQDRALREYALTEEGDLSAQSILLLRAPSCSRDSRGEP